MSDRPRLKPIKGAMKTGHQRFPTLPTTGEDAREFLMTNKANAPPPMRPGIERGFAGMSEEQLIGQAKIVYGRLKAQWNRAQRFGLAKPRGTLTSRYLETPVPGWILRSMRLAGPANPRDLALWLRAVAQCNLHLGTAEMDSPEHWAVSRHELAGRLFGPNIGRLSSSMKRLCETTMTVVGDAIAPRLKILDPVPLIQAFREDGDVIGFSMEPVLLQALLSERHYAHVNTESLMQLRSTPAARLYFIALGCAAEGRWNQVGGKFQAIIPSEDFLKAFGVESRMSAGVFVRDVLKSAIASVSRRSVVTFDQEREQGLWSYEGKDRLDFRVKWNKGSNNSPTIDSFEILGNASHAAREHRSRQQSDSRFMKHVHSADLILDFRAIRSDRGSKRLAGRRASEALNYEQRLVNRIVQGRGSGRKHLIEDTQPLQQSAREEILLEGPDELELMTVDIPPNWDDYTFDEQGEPYVHPIDEEEGAYEYNQSQDD